MYSGQLGVIYDSQTTNRSTAEEGGSHRESSLLSIGHLGIIYDTGILYVLPKQAQK